MQRKWKYPKRQQRQNLDLGTDVICRMNSDYTSARVILALYPDDKKAQRLKKECEDFFMSEHFARLSDFPSLHLEHLKKRADVLCRYYKLTVKREL